MFYDEIIHALRPEKENKRLLILENKKEFPKFTKSEFEFCIKFFPFFEKRKEKLSRTILDPRHLEFGKKKKRKEDFY